MAASKYDFLIEQGSSFRLSLVYKDSNGTPINLTDWCARLIWTTNRNNTQSFLTTNLDYSVYKFSIDEINGKLTLLIPPETTNIFDFETAKYDLELQSGTEFYNGSGNDIIRILYGTVTLNKRNSKNDTLFACNQ